jgi:hypothetical protein
MVTLTFLQIGFLFVAAVVGKDALALVVVRWSRHARRRPRPAIHSEEIRHLMELRRVNMRRLRHQQVHAAHTGIRTDPAILMEIEDLQTAIEQIDNELLGIAGSERGL